MPNWIPVTAWYDTESGKYYMGAQPPSNPQPQYQQPQYQQPRYSNPQPQYQQPRYSTPPTNYVMAGGPGGLVRYYQPAYQQPVNYEYYFDSYGRPVPMRVYPSNYTYPGQIGAYTGETNWQAAFPQQQVQQVQQPQVTRYVPAQVEQEIPSGADLGEQIVEDAITQSASYQPLPSAPSDDLDNLVASASNVVNTAVNNADTTLTSGITVDENGDVNIESATNEQALENARKIRKQRKKELEEREFNRIYNSPIGL